MASTGEKVSVFRRLGQILIGSRLITPEVLQEGLARAKSERRRLGEALTTMNAVSQDDVLRALATQQGLPFLAADDLPSTLPLIKNLSPKYLRQYAACPIKVDTSTITVAAEASDIHVEPYEDRLRIRYRLDGILHDRESPPRRLQAALTSRIKLMAEMNIAERRLPQDGRIRVTAGDRRVDIRVSTVPTVHGESLVMRLLDRSSVFLPFNRLGFSAGVAESFEGLIRRPHGILLVTGPTGSGKTTTLYAALDKINSPDKKIITIEDPVEYQLAGVNQIPVHSNIGLSFAAGLRHIVRQDPDVIMVGEIRDLETAEISIQAALTGHLVMSTLHTNDAP